MQNPIYTVDIRTCGEEIAAWLAWIKTVTPMPLHPSAVYSPLLTDVFNEIVKISFIKFWPVGTHLFNIQGDKIGSSHKILLLHLDYEGWLSWGGKSTVGLFDLWAHLATFHGMLFFLGRAHGRQPGYSDGYLTNIFSKVSEVSLSLKTFVSICFQC